MREDQREKARIMVVDDEPQNVRYVTDVLEWAGYETVEGLTDPLEAVSRFEGFNPDLVILDLLMPGMNGFDVMDAMREKAGDDVYLPFLILTSDISSESRRRALSSGARDFLTKPMSPTEVRLRVDNLLETRFLYLECARQANLLQVDEVSTLERDDGTLDSTLELLERWGASLDAMLPGWDGRSKRVSWLAARIAEALDLPDETVEVVLGAALLHGLGSRPLPSSPGERGFGGRVYADSQTGLRLLEGSGLPVLEAAHRMLASIHEHWDGSGHPSGLRGEAIPIEARIVAVACAFDDLERSDAGASGLSIEAASGSRFDPAVVEALVHAQVVGT